MRGEYSEQRDEVCGEWSDSAHSHICRAKGDEGASVAALAEELGRGPGGIEARLVRLGLVPDRETARTRP